MNSSLKAQEKREKIRKKILFGFLKGKPHTILKVFRIVCKQSI